MNGISAHFALPHVAKILYIRACSDYYVPLGWQISLSSKKITSDFSRFFRLKNDDFCVLGGFWVFFFQSIQQAKLIQENVLIIIFQFCSIFCFHQHQNCEILPINF